MYYANLKKMTKILNDKIKSSANITLLDFLVKESLVDQFVEEGIYIIKNQAATLHSDSQSVGRDPWRDAKAL